jgi:hypothetical protein
MDTQIAPALFCHTVARSQNGKAPARYPYWCVARYEAKPRRDGTLTWRRVLDITPGYRSPQKAIRESGVSVLIHVRQHSPVTL